MKKTTSAFDTSLAVISIIGFFLIFLKSFFSVDIGAWQTTLLMVLAGTGLMYEGRVTTIKSWARNGIQGYEFAYLFTIIFGLFSIVIGILAIPYINLLSPQLHGIVGLTSFASIVFIIIQKWVVN